MKDIRCLVGLHEWAGGYYIVPQRGQVMGRIKSECIRCDYYTEEDLLEAEYELLRAS